MLLQSEREAADSAAIESRTQQDKTDGTVRPAEDLNSRQRLHTASWYGCA
jgi:hypothetical protein